MKQNKFSLEGKRALVCGASRGLGLATARALAERGASIILLSRNQEKLDIAKKSLPEGNHQTLSADLSDSSGLEQVLKSSEKLFSSPIHILVNNAGGPPAGALVNATIDQFRAALEAHLFCSHLLASRCLEGMKESGYGRILNIISTSVKQPIAGLGVSNTTRGAMASWSKTMSLELAPFGITVNNILPGATLTDRLQEIFVSKAKTKGVSVAEVEEEMKTEIPMGRFGTPEEFAEVVAFLASPAASYVSGVSIAVDGARTTAL